MTWPLSTTFTWSIGACIVISLLPWGNYALYPFKLFTTWVHELCHALMVILVGGKVTQITLSPDTSGLTQFQLSSSRIKQSLVASAGYLGSCAVGCLIYYLSQTQHLSPSKLLLGLGSVMLLSLLIWVRNLFGFFTLLTMSAGLIYLSQKPLPPDVVRYFIPFLGVQTGLQTLLDLKGLFGPGSKGSDAHTMQSLFWLPAFFWALLWIAISVWSLYWVGSMLR